VCEFRDPDSRKAVTSHEHVASLEARIASLESFVAGLKSASTEERNRMIDGISLGRHTPMTMVPASLFGKGLVVRACLQETSEGISNESVFRILTYE